ncbi:DUF1127 domain-containing protein [Vineibacter terrae]|uniref:DUF1127 domain-containing protein n=1 Tax=Vineibacter terrae TaxID=2586908 RepID=A0A5C8P5X0_9HYPH|nr:DUF1127 domain-containing protein [Vineibacter terrae]TXL69136.1 DUF1127 domain-containing protein [Vineibacter terrae]
MSIAVAEASIRVPRARRARLVLVLAIMAKRFLRRRAERIAVRQLYALPDRTLKDIGISRSQIAAAARRR